MHLRGTVNIRRAGLDDVDTVCDMGERFLAMHPHARLVGAKREDARRGIEAIMGVGAIFLAEIEGRICGMLLCGVAPMWFAPSLLMAHELGWWVNEEARHTSAALRLIKAYEGFAAECGVRACVMSRIHTLGEDRVGPLLERMGYEESESQFVKLTGG